MVAGRLLGDCWEVIKRLFGGLNRLFTSNIYKSRRVGSSREIIAMIFKRILGG